MEISFQEIRVERTAVKKLQKRPITIALIGDVHYGDKAADIPALKQHLEQITDLGPDVYYIGLGDYIDFSAASNEYALRTAKLHETTREIIDDAAKYLCDEFVKIVKKSKGRWLGMVTGNHKHEFIDGTNSDMKLCTELDAPYLGHCGYLKLEFMRANGISRGAVKLWVHHGHGGGQSIAAPLNKLYRISGHFDADIYVMAHSHRTAYTYFAYYRMSGHRVIERTKHLVAAGSFRKAYQLHSKLAGRPEGSYEERRAYTPIAVGAPVIRIWPRMTGRTKKGRREPEFAPMISIDGPRCEVGDIDEIREERTAK